MEKQYPRCILSNDLIAVEVYLPDSETGYCRGPRFDWSGMVGNITWGKHSFCGEWKKNIPPENAEHAAGTADEFSMGVLGMPSPLGYNEAKPGESFLKIGVGLLQKEANKDYSFGFNYRVLQPGKWKIKRDKNMVEFHQSMTGTNGYAYAYTKTIRLAEAKPGFSITRSLHNTGTKRIETTQYCHNFTMLDDEPAGPKYEIIFPFMAVAEKDMQGLAGINNGKLTFTRELQEKEAVFTTIAGFKTNDVSHNGVSIINIKTGARMDVRGTKNILRYHFYAARTAVCPEQFVYVSIAPGETDTWQTTYEFSSVSPIGVQTDSGVPKVSPANKK